ncbi:14157_t:CDS:1 [Funneliformis mosseae]|uniref:14157_t:CDS:1 n=1 Tax=Funneliformis mosseae TaxID=27381 RepID=A0A9N8VEZ3_FUNMO|nr:14157_t:CDS:1 [Funneliformis mosseae]
MAVLPPELWKEIVDFFSDYQSLRSLLLVNKTFSSFAVRKLYDRIIIGPHIDFNKLADTISMRSNGSGEHIAYYDYAFLTHTISITSCDRENEFPWFRLPLVLAQCSNVNGILISPREQQYAEPQTIAVMEIVRSTTLVTKYLAKAVEILSSRKIRKLCLRSLRFLGEFQRHGSYFSTALSYLHDLESLELWHENGRPLGDVGKKCIVKLIENNDLKEINLDCYVADDLELENLVSIFINLPNLHSLTWWGTRFNKEEEEFLYHVIFQYCRNLKRLIIEVSGFHEGEDFLILSRHCKGLEELITWHDIDGGALPLSTLMNLIVMNKSTLKRVDAWVSLADPPVTTRHMVNTFDDSDLDTGSELDDNDQNDPSAQPDQFEFYHPANTNSYSEWIESLFNKFWPTNKAWNDNYDISVSNPNLSGLLSTYRQDIESDWQMLVEEHLEKPIKDICLNLDELKLFLTYW